MTSKQRKANRKKGPKSKSKIEEKFIVSDILFLKDILYDNISKEIDDRKAQITAVETALLVSFIPFENGEVCFIHPGRRLGPGGLGVISTVFGSTSVAGDIASMSNSTFRLANSKGEFSPKIYTPKLNRPYGWKGGFGINTYSISKFGRTVAFGSSVLTTGSAYYDIAVGQQQPITYVDAGVGTTGLISTIAFYYTGVQAPYVGEFVSVYGTIRLTWDVFFYLGANYGPKPKSI